MMNGFNQYLCDFCQQPCRRSTGAKEYGKHARWQRCLSCKVSYAISLTGQVKCRIFRGPGEDEFYQLRINYKENISTICFLKKDSWMYNNRKQTTYNSTQIVTLDHCIKDISPQNVQDKIKLYILFS